MESLKFTRSLPPPEAEKTLFGPSQPLRFADCFPKGTFFLQVSNIILIIGVVCTTLHFTLQKISFFGPNKRSKKCHAWQIHIIFAHFTLIYSQQPKDQFFFSQGYKGGPCPAQRHLLSGHASCVTSDTLFILLDTPHKSWQVCIMSNAEGCTLCNTSNLCAPFVRIATTFEMIS